MDGTRISRLASGVPLTGGEYVPITQNGTTVKVDSSYFKTTNASDLTTGTVSRDRLPVASTIATGIIKIGTTEGTACDGQDYRLSNPRPPVGSAGGDLTGNYPTPQLVQTGVQPGTYGDSNFIPVISVNSKGLLTNVAYAPVGSSAGGTVKSVDITSTSLTITGSPITESGTISIEGALTTSQLGVPNGIAQLDSSGLVKGSQMPPLTTTQLAQISASSIGAIPASEVGIPYGIAYLDGSGVLAAPQAPPLSTTQLAQITPQSIGALSTSQLGIVNGVCPLNSSAQVASQYLPSYVDDIIEVASYTALPNPGETGKIYVTLDLNLTYRWSGSAYVQVDSGPTPGSTTPLASSGSGGVGVYASYARADHYHPISTLAELGAAPRVPEVNNQTGTTYTLDPADSGKTVTLTNASAITVTIPQNGFAVGMQTVLLQLGAGQVSITPATGVTLSSTGTKRKIAGQYSVATLIQVATNSWILGGDITT